MIGPISPGHQHVVVIFAGMKHRALPWGLLCVFLVTGKAMLFGQVVNTEERRLTDKDTGWVGSISLSGGYQENIQTIYTADADMRLQYMPEISDTWLLLGNYSLWRADGVNFINNGYLHLRRTWRAHKTVSPEAFVQAQRNLVFRSDARMLAGAGLRYHLIGRRDTSRFFLSLGTVYMLEYEDETDEGPVHRDQRLSNYISFSWEPRSGFQLINTTYYLPKLADFADYRILSDAQLRFPLNGYLYYRMSLSILFDTRPPAQIPERWLSLQNGIGAQF